MKEEEQKLIRVITFPDLTGGKNALNQTNIRFNDVLKTLNSEEKRIYTNVQSQTNVLITALDLVTMQTFDAQKGNVQTIAKDTVTTTEVAILASMNEILGLN